MSDGNNFRIVDGSWHLDLPCVEVGGFLFHPTIYCGPVSRPIQAQWDSHLEQGRDIISQLASATPEWEEMSAEECMELIKLKIRKIDSTKPE